ncbi:MAG: hypothetical protein HRT57_06125 [Crocinitomicaceae bacterium]|nr:hypothetical protein [Crocinitomicaceae bacterium]
MKSAKASLNILKLNSIMTFMKVHFEEIHPDFYRCLNELNSSLTHKDLRLAAFLKMRLTNKEIALLLSISLAGAKKAIQRLRKKLFLKKDDNLRKIIGLF